MSKTINVRSFEPKVLKSKLIQARVSSQLYDELMEEQQNSIFENMSDYIRYLLGKNPKRKRVWK